MTDATRAKSIDLEPWLREILRCPACYAELADSVTSAGAFLVCTAQECSLAYPVMDNIPVLLIDEAISPR